MKPFLNPLRETLQLADYQSQRRRLLAPPQRRSLLLLEPGEPLPGCPQPGLEFLPFQQPVPEGVDQPRHPTPGPLDQRRQLPRLPGPASILAAEPLLVLVPEPVGVRQQRPHVLPDGRVGPVAADLPAPADPLAPEPVGLSPAAAVVGVGPLPLAGRRPSARLAA